MGSSRRRCAMVVLALAWAALAAALTVAPLAGATHDINHRYFVYGAVTNTSGVPLPGIAITVEVPGATTYSSTPLWTGVTDTNGNYRMLLHLHHLGESQEDSGREMVVRVPSASIERRATAQLTSPPPGDDPESTGWGYTKIDLQLDQAGPSTAPAPTSADLASWLAGNALGVVVALVAVAVLIVAVTKLRWQGEEARLQRQELSVAKLPGVGRATAERLRAIEIATIPQLARATAPQLSEAMGVSQTEAQRLIRKATSFYRRDH